MIRWVAEEELSLSHADTGTNNAVEMQSVPAAYLQRHGDYVPNLCIAICGAVHVLLHIYFGKGDSAYTSEPRGKGRERLPNEYLSKVDNAYPSENLGKGDNATQASFVARETMSTKASIHLQGLAECCFASTETVGLLGTGAQDGHLDCHTAPEL